MSSERLIKQLYRDRLMKNEEEMDSFYTCMDHLSERRDVNLSLELFMILDDNTEDPVGMTFFSRYLEHFEDYIEKMVEFTPTIIGNTEESLEIMYRRLLNKPETFEELLNMVSNTRDENQRVILKIFERIAETETNSDIEKVSQIKAKISQIKAAANANKT